MRGTVQSVVGWIVAAVVAWFVLAWWRGSRYATNVAKEVAWLLRRDGQPEEAIANFLNGMWFSVLVKSEFGVKTPRDCALHAIVFYFENLKTFGGQPQRPSLLEAELR